jgi:hypothetical protein
VVATALKQDVKFKLEELVLVLPVEQSQLLVATAYILLLELEHIRLLQTIPEQLNT